MKPEQLLGKRIRELRKARKLSIEQLAEMTGVNDKYLGSVERGEQNPSFKVTSKVAEALSVELPALFKFEHIEEDEQALRNKIGALLKKSNPEQLQTVIKIIKGVIE